MLLNQIVEFAQFGTAKATGFRELGGSEPEFRVAPGLLNVDVMRLGTFAAEEKKAVPEGGAPNSDSPWPMGWEDNGCGHRSPFY